VHAALAFYDDHQGEIQAEIAEEDRAFEELRAKQLSVLEKSLPLPIPGCKVSGRPRITCRASPAMTPEADSRLPAMGQSFG
jgi:hypothetical protein